MSVQIFSEKTATVVGNSTVLFYSSFASFPVTGQEGYVYIDQGAKATYIWDAGMYTQVGVGPVDTDDLAEGTTNLYYTNARADARIAVHTAAGDPHPQYALDSDLAGKANTSHTHALSDITQSGATSGQVPNWNGSAWVPTTISGGSSDHGSLSGLADDDHTQYHNDTRGDARYYTKTQMDAGQMDSRYFTESEVTSALSGKEDVVTAGTTSQYYRGDKTFQTLNKTAVGLTNVDNTSDVNKPISTATQTALNAKEGSIATGTTSQYWRGDKSWQTLDKSAVGLSSVDNTTDLNKPISTATQTALDSKVSDDSAIAYAIIFGG